MRISFLILFFGFVVPQIISAAHAQTAADLRGGGDPGGSIIPGYDSRTCDGTIEGAIRYNSSTTCAEFCDSSSWVCPSSSGIGYFVISSTTYDGNLSGLSGANSTCLSNLQSNNWLGKTEAGTLTSARVKAWLCDSSTCQNLEADTTYKFAVSGSTTVGGSAFVTDSNGAGPGYTTDWADSNTFDNATAHRYWTNFANNSTSLWGTTANSNHCNDWSDNTNSYQGQQGYENGTGAVRWNDSTVICSQSKYLICFVNP
ncbi:hypothetical protein [Albidovulum aquaemixtae]|nr:hypothetical protein [Defluviimonas aquaemixtae]